MGRSRDDDLGLDDADAPAHPSAHPSFSRKLPAQLGRYLLIEQLGAGGMAEVFRAKQQGPSGFERVVVVKVLFPHLARSVRYRKMFQREASLAARLSHTNVVQVLELGSEDGPPYIAMEFVDGISLHKLARRAWTLKRALPLELCAGAIADAALGLAHAHHEGLVHRDVSPDNLMITRDGAMTKVLDFGIAKGVDSESVTRTGELKGKVPFMAPELVRGAEATALTDIYALGVTFYWLVTGRRPFSGANDIVTLQAIVEQTPPTPRSINPSLPERVDVLIRTMIARDPAQRPQDATAVHEALRWALVARHSVVEPFVAEMLAAQDGPRDDDDPDTSGFVPSVPSLDVDKAMDLTAAPTPHKARVETPRGPRRRRAPVLAAAVAGALVLGAAVAWRALRADTDEAHTDDPPPRAAPLVVRPELAPGDELEVPPLPPDEEPTLAPADADDVRRRRRTTAVPTSADLDLRAPAGVRWLDGTDVLGSGNLRVQVKRTTRFLTAVDQKRGARSRVPVVDGVADYGALPKGRIKVRATPYAEIFLGSEARGSTPYQDMEVVTGEYTLTLKNRGREEKRTVTVRPGDVARIEVRFDP